MAFLGCLLKTLEGVSSSFWVTLTAHLLEPLLLYPFHLRVEGEQGRLLRFGDKRVDPDRQTFGGVEFALLLIRRVPDFSGKKASVNRRLNAAEGVNLLEVGEKACSSASVKVSR